MPFYIRRSDKEKNPKTIEMLNLLIQQAKQCLGCQIYAPLNKLKPIPRVVKNYPNFASILPKPTIIPTVSRKALCTICYSKWSKSKDISSFLQTHLHPYDQYLNVIEDLLNEFKLEFIYSLNSRCSTMFDNINWK